MSAAEHVVVIGGGTMGRGIAVTTLVNAQAVVSIVDTNAAAHAQLRSAVAADAESRGASCDGRLHVVGSLDSVATADLIVEAVPEILGLKRDVLRAAESRLTPSGVLASNTSSLSITELANQLSAPERFLGMHFFQPVPDTTLTELILHPGVATATVRAAERWTAELGREAISATDTPGFATSRLGLAIGLEAMRMFEDGVASAADIDRGMQLGYQHGVGPLRMTDMVGLDVRLAIAEYLTATLGSRFEPPQILRDMVARGDLGRKSGQGFFSWPEP